VLTVYADRTDPRDPANTAATPAWEVALRNGLRAVADRLEAAAERDARLRFRDRAVTRWCTTPSRMCRYSPTWSIAAALLRY